MQLKETTLHNYEPGPPPAFPSNSPCEGEEDYGKIAQSINDEATIVNEENLFVGQR